MDVMELKVTGMSCAHCERAIDEEVRTVAGVTDVEVSAQTGRLVVTAQHPLDPAQLIAAVDEAGYHAETI